MVDLQESRDLPQNQPPVNHSQQCSLGIFSSSPLPPSSPPMPTSSAPPYADDGHALRRASIDSDSSIFSHFSLTPESQAGLRVWEDAILGPATPAASRDHAPCTGQSTRRWIVFKGRVPGVYHTVESARSQTDGIPNAVSLAYANANHAERDYERFVADGTIPPFGSGPWVVYVGRATGVFTDLGAVKSAIDDYPNSHCVTCTSLNEATELYSLYHSLSSKSARNPESSQLSHQAPASTSHNPDPNSGGQQSQNLRPFQPFVLDESIRSLTGHESWWVTWAAVRPGVYFGIDELLLAGPMAGGYRSVEDETEGFQFLHLLIKSRLVRKLQAPPS